MDVDLNADLGEGGGDDAAILTCVSSANIACGWHAGDSLTMRAAIQESLRHHVSIGAHPSFPDRANFGRSPMQRDPELVYIDLLYQIGGLQSVVQTMGGQLRHVKPHGALYNQAARDPTLADAIALAVKTCSSDLKLMGLAGSELIAAAHRHGLIPIEEVFADRAYLSDGSLAPREMPGAVIEDAERALQQTLQMITQGTVTTIDGQTIPIRAESICLHGDGTHALIFARTLRHALESQGLKIRAPA
ncbi:5-oxoprolinase subunit PxpA [Chitinivorax sp. B]|uniref:5-oxoprolinase subunit PxpA n=1 Tax=Chitinivorax sp. B TaxID=2502235 RepID=UPI0010F84E2E|nr:5-oxoprolinase subunit PxpA [Chitinivorax sp. B]